MMGGHAAEVGRLGVGSPLIWEDILPFWGSSEPCESSYPEANELVTIQRLLIFPSI